MLRRDSWDHSVTLPVFSKIRLSFNLCSSASIGRMVVYNTGQSQIWAQVYQAVTVNMVTCAVPSVPTGREKEKAESHSPLCTSWGEERRCCDMHSSWCGWLAIQSLALSTICVTCCSYIFVRDRDLFLTMCLEKSKLFLTGSTMNQYRSEKKSKDLTVLGTWPFF